MPAAHPRFDRVVVAFSLDRASGFDRAYGIDRASGFDNGLTLYRSSRFVGCILTGVLCGCSASNINLERSGAHVLPGGEGTHFRLENRAVSSEYEVFGKSYVVYRSAKGFSQTGIASWYGPGFHGRTTANGEKYDMRKISAAHKNLPFGTILRVENLENGLVLNVRVNDRGPFHSGRVIDLSRQAAERLGVIQKGTARVRLSVYREKRAPAPLQAANDSSVSVRINPNWNTENYAPATVEKSDDFGLERDRVQATFAVADAADTDREQIKTQFTRLNSTPNSTEKSMEIWVQIGSYNQINFARIAREELEILGFSQVNEVRIFETTAGKDIHYKVRLGPFDLNGAKKMLDEIRAAGYYDAFMVR